MRESPIDPIKMDQMTRQEYAEAISQIYSQDEYLCLRDMMERGISTLTDQQQAVIRARYWDSKTLDEVAAELGVSVRSIRVLEERSIKYLKRFMLADQPKKKR